jgi:hypothetical protein
VKLAKSIRIKETTSLFMNKYQYKVVLVCSAATWFRGNDLDNVHEKLSALDNPGTKPPSWFNPKTKDEIDFSWGLHNMLATLSDYTLRIEHPIINVYTNTSLNVEKLAGINPVFVKYLSIPNKSSPTLGTDVVIVKNLDFDYKVTVGRTRKEHQAFVTWAENNSNIRITNKCKKDLTRQASWGGGYFYVKGDKTLTMVRMFLGGEIGRIETVVKA